MTPKHDLNLLREVVCALTKEQRRTYRFHLRNLCGTYEDAIDASAEERAEAICRALDTELK